MDADHRHELKQNDLEEFLHHFKEFWAKWGQTITIGLLLIVLIYTGKTFLDTRRETRRERALADLATSTSPEALLALAEEVGDPAVRVRALLRAGDLLLVSVVAPPREDDGQVVTPLDPSQREQRLTQAAAVYRQVVEEAPAPLFAHNARLGLAAVAETQGQWDEARRQYEAVRDQAAALFPAIAQQARARLAMLDRLTEPVVFAPPEASATPDAPDAPDAPVMPVPTESPQVQEPQDASGEGSAAPVAEEAATP